MRGNSFKNIYLLPEKASTVKGKNWLFFFKMYQFPFNKPSPGLKMTSFREVDNSRAVVLDYLQNHWIL